MNRIFLLGALTLVGLVPLAIGTASATTNPADEGDVHELRAPDSFQWRLAAGEYVLRVRAGADGADLDLRGLRLTSDPEPVKHLQPNTGFTAAVEFDQGEMKQLGAVKGSARMVISRMDLARWPVGAPPDHLEAQDELAPYACHSYDFQTLGMSDKYSVSGHGTGLRFRVYNQMLVMVLESTDAFSSKFDPNVYEEDSLVIQVCNPSDGSDRSFVVNMVYPAPGDPSTETPSVGPSPLFLGLGITMYFSRRPAGRPRSP